MDHLLAAQAMHGMQVPPAANSGGASHQHEARQPQGPGWSYWGAREGGVLPHVPPPQDYSGAGYPPAQGGAAGMAYHTPPALAQTQPFHTEDLGAKRKRDEVPADHQGGVIPSRREIHAEVGTYPAGTTEAHAHMGATPEGGAAPPETSQQKRARPPAESQHGQGGLEAATGYEHPTAPPQGAEAHGSSFPRPAAPTTGPGALAPPVQPPPQVQPPQAPVQYLAGTREPLLPVEQPEDPNALPVLSGVPPGQGPRPEDYRSPPTPRLQKTCEGEGCEATALYCRYGEPPRFCMDHRTLESTWDCRFKMCAYRNCTKRALKYKPYDLCIQHEMLLGFRTLPTGRLAHTPLDVDYQGGRDPRYPPAAPTAPADPAIAVEPPAPRPVIPPDGAPIEIQLGMVVEKTVPLTIRQVVMTPRGKRYRVTAHTELFLPEDEIQAMLRYQAEQPPRPEPPYTGRHSASPKTRGGGVSPPAQQKASRKTAQTGAAANATLPAGGVPTGLAALAGAVPDTSVGGAGGRHALINGNAASAEQTSGGEMRV